MNLETIKNRAFATLFAIASFSFQSALGQNLVVIDCPPGMMQAGPNLCVQPIATGEKSKIYHYTDKRETENKTIVEAQMTCRAQAAHVCTYDEIYEAWEVVKGDLAGYEALGNQGQDDHHLCVNNPKDKHNFEGSCHKHYKLRYRCCMSASGPMLGMGM
jgi:hypothetical protein